MEISRVLDYDVVVVGAGSPGVPYALAAAEAGTKVALTQKEATAAACGNAGAGITLDKSDPADVQALLSRLMADSAHRPKREVLEVWADNSGEAISWLMERSREAGAQVSDFGNGAQAPLLEETGYDIDFVTSYFGPKPSTRAKQ